MPINMIRILFVVVFGFVWAALPAHAQGADRLPRIGFLGNSTATLEANLIGPFRDGLRDLGYVEGQNILIEYQWAEGKYERFPALIAELIALKVDVIVTAGTPASLAVKKATTSVPLVMIAVGDPVGTGLVASLARPGGNATGVTSISPELEGKRLELLREVFPGVARIAVLWNPVSPFQVVIGNTQTGMGIGYGSCRSGPILLLTVRFFGQGLSQPCCEYPVVPDSNHGLTQVIMVSCDFLEFEAIGAYAIVNPTPSCQCGSIKVEEATWGRVKSLYSSD